MAIEGRTRPGWLRVLCVRSLISLTLPELDPDFTRDATLLVAVYLGVEHRAVDHLKSLLDLFLQVGVHLRVVLLI